eukprot:NP_493851.3 C-type LECtin [Caenorhabditis elegans]
MFSGGSLVSIHNSIDNRALVQSSISYDPKWIGLICSDANKPCNWTDHSSDTSNYNNFDAGNPNLYAGNYTLMAQSGSAAGKWVSADDFSQFRYISTTAAISTRAPATTPEAPGRCPAGSSSLNDITCVKLFDTPMIFQGANLVCRNISGGGNLVSIHSAEDNTALLNLAALNNKTKTIWLGLTCQSPSPSSCEWTDGSGTTSNYNNFTSGYPKPVRGPRGYMWALGSDIGKWFSSDEDYSTHSFFCEVPKSSNVSAAETPLILIFHFCYSVNTYLLSEPDAREFCLSLSEDLVSIHSQAENDFIQSLISNTVIDEFRTGAATDGVGKYWVDGSFFDYSNFGYFGTNLGKCSSLSMSGSVVSKGQWLSNDCSNKIPFICKHPKHFSTPAPYVSGQCNETQFLSGKGTFYSPNYSYGFSGYPNPCTYLITEPPGTIAQLRFAELHLPLGRTIVLYSGIDETKPLAIVTENTFEVYSSTTNVLRVVFNCPLTTIDNYIWAVNYGTDLS